MQMTYAIHPLSDADDNERSHFYQKVFPGRSDVLSKHWRWWYRVGYLDQEPLIVIERNRVIGQAGLIPVSLSFRGNQFSAIWFVDFSVLPEYQGQGIGKELTQRWMELCPNQITFCNEKSANIFEKFGWHQLSSTYRCGAPIQPLHWLPIPIHKKIIDSKIASLASIWLKLILRNAPTLSAIPLKDHFYQFASLIASKENPESKISILRDESWLEWRLLKCPFANEYHFFEYGESIAIVHKFDSNHLHRVHILYLAGPNKDSEIILYQGITKWSIQQGADLVWMNTSDPDLPSEIKKFFPFQSPLRFVSWSEEPSIHQELKTGISNIQAIDGDNDLYHPHEHL
jgi:GNAT superfamily N-acetyltransferase